MTFLVAAFVSVWIVITAYLLYLGQTQRKLEADLQVLGEIVEENPQ